MLNSMEWSIRAFSLGFNIIFYRMLASYFNDILSPSFIQYLYLPLQFLVTELVIANKLNRPIPKMWDTLLLVITVIFSLITSTIVFNYLKA
jgi:hypothetical protein